MHFLTLLASLFPASFGMVSPGLAPSASAPVVIRVGANGDIGGTVADSAVGTPLVGGEVRILQGDNLVATTVTNAFGRYVIHNLPAGVYRVEVRYLGYRAQTHDLSVGATEGSTGATWVCTRRPRSLHRIGGSSGRARAS